MKRVRTVLFWGHLVSGVSAGLVILVMAATGVLLAFEKQLVAFADRGFRSAPPSPGAPPLAPEAALAALLASRPDAVPTSITLRRGPDAPFAVGLPEGRVVYLDAYDGHVLGDGSRAVRDFLGGVEDVHRSLAFEGPARSRARLLTGVANLLFLFIVLSGLFLWLPRVWTAASVRAVAWFRPNLSGRARDFNWHNTIGLWAWLPLVVIVASAVPLSFTWGGDLVYRLAGETPPKRPPQGPGGRGPAKPGGPAAWRGLDGAIAAARSRDGWRTLSIRIPASSDAPLVVSVDSGTGGQPQKRGQLTVDRESGAVMKWEPFQAGTPGRRARAWLRFLHTGEALGLGGQIVAAIASAGVTVLVWTGLALAFRRFFRKAPATAAVSLAAE